MTRSEDSELRKILAMSAQEDQRSLDNHRSSGPSVSSSASARRPPSVSSPNRPVPAPPTPSLLHYTPSQMETSSGSREDASNSFPAQTGESLPSQLQFSNWSGPAGHPRPTLEGREIGSPILPVSSGGSSKGIELGAVRRSQDLAGPMLAPQLPLSGFTAPHLPGAQLPSSIQARPSSSKPSVQHPAFTPSNTSSAPDPLSSFSNHSNSHSSGTSHHQPTSSIGSPSSRLVDPTKRSASSSVPQSHNTISSSSHAPRRTVTTVSHPLSHLQRFSPDSDSDDQPKLPPVVRAKPKPRIKLKVANVPSPKPADDPPPDPPASVPSRPASATTPAVDPVDPARLSSDSPPAHDSGYSSESRREVEFEMGKHDRADDSDYDEGEPRKKKAAKGKAAAASANKKKKAPVAKKGGRGTKVADAVVDTSDDQEGAGVNEVGSSSARGKKSGPTYSRQGKGKGKKHPSPSYSDSEEDVGQPVVDASDSLPSTTPTTEPPAPHPASVSSRSTRLRSVSIVPSSPNAQPRPPARASRSRSNSTVSTRSSARLSKSSVKALSLLPTVQEDEDDAEEEEEAPVVVRKPGKGKGSKRKVIVESDEEEEEASSKQSPPKKKAKTVPSYGGTDKKGQKARRGKSLVHEEPESDVDVMMLGNGKGGGSGLEAESELSDLEDIVEVDKEAKESDREAGKGADVDLEPVVDLDSEPEYRPESPKKGGKKAVAAKKASVAGTKGKGKAPAAAAVVKKKPKAAAASKGKGTTKGKKIADELDEQVEGVGGDPGEEDVEMVDAEKRVEEAEAEEQGVAVVTQKKVDRKGKGRQTASVAKEDEEEVEGTEPTTSVVPMSSSKSSSSSTGVHKKSSSTPAGGRVTKPTKRPSVGLTFVSPLLSTKKRSTSGAGPHLQDVINKIDPHLHPPSLNNAGSAPSGSGKTKAKAAAGPSKPSGPPRRVLGLSKTAKLPSLHKNLKPDVKRLENAPKKSVKPKKSDPNRDDYDDTEWAELEKARKKAEREMDWSDVID